MNTETNQEQEFDAIVLEMKRAQRTNYLKFGALMVLLFIAVAGILTMVSMVPAGVLAAFGG